MMVHHKTITASLIFLGAAIFLYAFYQVGYAINSDNALMVEYARRWLDGGRLGLDVYDPNPPGSFLIYLPVVFMAKYLPVWHAITLYTTFLVLCSAWAVRALLKGGEVDTGGQLVILAAYLLGNLALANVFYGERDHLIFLGLMPFVLLQYNLMLKRDVPKTLSLGVLGIGSALIMVKPHYILMPAAMILWRVCRERSIRSVWRADTLALLIAMALYSGLLWFIFPEYLKEILPAVAVFYAPDADISRLSINVLIVFVGGLIYALYLTTKAEQAARKLSHLLMVLSICLLGASLGQLKGYYYHAVPLFITMFVLLSYILYQYLSVKSWLKGHSVAATIFVLVSASFIVMPPATTYLTHENFKTTGISDLYKKCTPPCSVFIFDEYPDIAVMAAVYNDAIFPSRFPSYWFLPDVVGENTSPEAAKYQALVAADFIRYKPDAIALVRTEVTLPDSRGELPFDFVRFFSQNADFAQQMKLYKKVGIFELDRRDYHRGTSLDVENKETFDLYRLKNPD